MTLMRHGAKLKYKPKMVYIWLAKRLQVFVITKSLIVVDLIFQLCVTFC